MKQTVIKIRGIVAILIMIIAAYQIISGIGMWLVNRGIVDAPGMAVFFYRSHPSIGFVFLIVAITHLTLNRKLLMSDLKVLRKKK